MAKLVITVSDGDRQNEILDWITQANPHEPAPPDETRQTAPAADPALADIVSAPDFPIGYVGRHVKYKGDDAQVLSVGSGGTSFTLYIFKAPSFSRKLNTDWARTHPSSL